METPREYYTYAYLREDGSPYYIGKGKEKRVFSSKRSINKPKNKSRIVFLKQNLTEEEAFKHEVYMIAVLGRKDLGTGILRNKTNGGEGTSGLIHSEEHKRKNSEANKGKKQSEETRKKQSEAKKGENHPNYGKSLSRETRKRLSEAKKGKNHPNYGKSHSEETRKRISESNKGKKRSEETRKNQSEARKGKIPWNMGKSPSEETRRKQSEVIKGKNNPNYGKRWWNDGYGNTKLSKECPEEGWVLGRKKKE